MPVSAPRSVPEATATARWPAPLLVAVLAWCAVISTLDSSGAVPWLGEGPGLTLDETFNVQMGVYHVRAIREYGLALLSFDSIREIFGSDVYNPDHPPLGRILIGLAHELSWPVFEPNVPTGSVAVTCGRVASAGAYAVTIFLIGWMTSRWYGRMAGLIASVSLVLMPRLFAHGHIAALETSIGLTYVATVLYVAHCWKGDRQPPWRAVIIGGVLFGLALLTKVQAVLLPIPIGIWALWSWRARAILPLLAFGMVGLCVFFVGWPWLWLDPLGHLSEYFGRTTERLTLYCWYMGRKWADTEVPWHYPVVMFAVTVPVGLHALGLLGLFRSWRSSPKPLRKVESIIALNVFWPLAFFAIPGITVYDGTRLFLMVFPLWAVFIGRGGSLLWHVLSQRRSCRFASKVIAVALAVHAWGVVAMHPVQLSYYNFLVGWTKGAGNLGFETTYWNDAVTRSFLSEIAKAVPATSTVDVAPVLHPFVLEEMLQQSPALRSSGIRLRAYDDQHAQDVDYVFVVRRKADSWESLAEGHLLRDIVVEVQRDGVQLAVCYDVRDQIENRYGGHLVVEAPF